jgi:hypothetical protein
MPRLLRGASVHGGQAGFCLRAHTCNEYLAFLANPISIRMSIPIPIRMSIAHAIPRRPRRGQGRVRVKCIQHLRVRLQGNEYGFGGRDTAGAGKAIRERYLRRSRVLGGDLVFGGDFVGVLPRD